MAAKKKSPPPLKVGDRVKIKYHPALRTRIVELRGALGPSGVQIYGVRIRHKPKPTYVELREDRLKVISTENRLGRPSLLGRQFLDLDLAIPNFAHSFQKANAS
jgi:hypothetical protein